MPESEVSLVMPSGLVFLAILSPVIEASRAPNGVACERQVIDVDLSGYLADCGIADDCGVLGRAS